jgi:hypothetical protein
MREQSSWLVFIVLGVGVAVRLLYLDADPYYYEWIGYIIDEGRWVQQARSLVLQRSSGEGTLTRYTWFSPLSSSWFTM